MGIPLAAGRAATRCLSDEREASGPRPGHPRAGRGSPHQIRQRDAESVGDKHKVVNECRVRGLLDPVHCLPVEACRLREPLLCEFLACAFGSDVVPDGSTMLQYPVGHGVGWHAYTLVAAVIDVCTIDGTFAIQTERASATDPPLKHPFEWNPALAVVQP